MEYVPDSLGRSSPATTTTRVRLPVSQPSMEKIHAAGGMAHIAALIGDGLSLTQIAASLSLPRSDLSGFLCNSNDPLYTLAMASSAEVLYDLADDILKGADTTSMATVAIAKERAALLIRRAGVRNARYAARPMTLDLTPQPPSAAPSFTVCILPSPNREERVIEHDQADLENT